jgi:hypothetical protein
MASPGQKPLPSDVVSDPSIESKAALAQAWEFLREGRLPESEAAFKRVIELSVDVTQGLCGLGIIQLMRADYSGAAVLFQNWLRLDPQNANAYYYLGEAWEKQNLPDAALALFKKALAIDPTHGGAQQKLGISSTQGASHADVRNPKPPQQNTVSGSLPEKKRDAPLGSQNRESKAGFIHGRVTSMQQRIEGLTIVRDFRLERRAPDGTVLPPLAIQLRSSRYTGFEGSILNGDELEVAAHHKPAGTLQVDEVLNLTSNAVVRVRKALPVFSFGPIQWGSAFPVMANAEHYGVIRGRVTVVQQVLLLGQKGFNPTVWNFRLQRGGPDGGSFPLVEVEMRGLTFEGSIAENDEVELNAAGYKTGDVVGVTKVDNITAKSVFKANKGSWFLAIGAGAAITRPRG